MMRVLALDLSTSVGWVIMADPAVGPLHIGTYKIAKGESQDDYGTRTLDLERWLEGVILQRELDLIAFESPFIPMASTNWGMVGAILKRYLPASLMGAVWGAIGKIKAQDKGFVTTQHTLRLQISLANTIETTAKRRGIRCLEVMPVSAKKALTGSGRSAKDQMIIAAKDLGWDIKDNHQADAGGVALVAISWAARQAAA